VNVDASAAVLAESRLPFRTADLESVLVLSRIPH